MKFLSFPFCDDARHYRAVNVLIIRSDDDLSGFEMLEAPANDDATHAQAKSH